MDTERQLAVTLRAHVRDENGKCSHCREKYHHDTDWPCVFTRYALSRGATEQLRRLESQLVMAKARASHAMRERDALATKLDKVRTLLDNAEDYELVFIRKAQLRAILDEKDGP